MEHGFVTYAATILVVLEKLVCTYNVYICMLHVVPLLLTFILFENISYTKILAKKIKKSSNTVLTKSSSIVLLHNAGGY